jgi:hypothetical protein
MVGHGDASLIGQTLIGLKDQMYGLCDGFMTTFDVARWTLSLGGDTRIALYLAAGQMPSSIATS